MNTYQLKLELFRKIDGLDKNTLTRLYDFLAKKNTSKDFWEELSDWQKEDIEAGLNDLNNGRKKDFSKVIAKYK